MTSTYIINCPVVDSELPVQFRKALDVLTTHPVIKPKVRSRGITAGKELNCYNNASVCAQTWGGEAVFGWLITEEGDAAFKSNYHLIGHAVWLDKDRNLADVTNAGHLLEENNKKYIGFLPLLGKKLKLNDSEPEGLKNYWYCSNHMYFRHAIANDMEYEWSCTYGSEKPLLDEEEAEEFGEVQFLGKLIHIRSTPKFVMDIACEHFAQMLGGRLTPESITSIWDAVKTRILVVQKGDSHIMRHSRNNTVSQALQQCLSVKNKSVICKSSIYEYSSDKFLYLSKGKSADCMDHRVTLETLVNPSLATGKFIQQIPPKAELVGSHEIPKSRGARKKLERVASKYKLTPQEVLLLSNPNHFPHPYLVAKVGFRKVERVGCSKQTKCFGSV